jgi:hypothetical protein
MLSKCMAKHHTPGSIKGTWRDLVGIRTAGRTIHVILRDGCANFLGYGFASEVDRGSLVDIYVCRILGT